VAGIVGIAINLASRPMDALRKRATFRFSEHDDIDHDRVLDEQGYLSSAVATLVLTPSIEQDDVIADLRRMREKTVQLQQTALTLIVSATATMYASQSIFLSLITTSTRQIAYISSDVNPVFAIFPAIPRTSATAVPFSPAFTLLSLIVHFNILILLHPGFVRSCLRLQSNPGPLSYNVLYVLSALGPMISLIFRLPWQTTAWWSSTAIIVFVVQSAMDAAESSSRGISKLESMRYVAPGA
jgi:hypothetical protein